MTKLKSHTCIAAIRNSNGKIMMAGDRRCSWGFHKAVIGPRPKVIKRSGMLFAGTGDAYLCDLICEVMPIPKNKHPKDSFLYMMNNFLDGIKQLLHDKSCEKDKLLTGGAEIIVSHQSNLYSLAIDINPAKNRNYLGVNPIPTPYAAGCGGMYAWGSLLTTDHFYCSGINDEERLKIALECAAIVSPGCDSNIDIIVED